MSKAKLKKRYPHVTNTDILIKNLRDAVRKAASPPLKKRVALHARDNSNECVETMAIIFGDRLDDAIAEYAAQK